MTQRHSLVLKVTQLQFVEHMRDELNMAQDGLRRWTDLKTNPCVEESNASLKCLDENNYNKSKCRAYFEAYKECKRAWNERKAKRRRQGLNPNDP